MSNTDITVTGDSATAVAHTIAHLVTTAEPGSDVFIRGIRNDDTLVRRDGAWQIHRRTHMPLWQYRASSMKPGYRRGMCPVIACRK